MAVFQVTDLRTVCEALEELLHGVGAAAEKRPKDIAWLLHCLYPLLDQFMLAVQHRLFECIVQHKTMLKLSYVLCNTFAQLFKNGFCVPRGESDDNGDDENGVEDNVAGTGIGEGEGKKDVSDEIENEGQVEGMQNESAPEQPDKKIDDEENGIEMDIDFGGQLEDIEAGDEDEDEENGGEDSGDEPEEQMGDVDSKANVVDEKLWGDDDKDGGNGEDEKTERDAPVQDAGGETEMAAKEDDAKQQEEPKQQDQGKEKDQSKHNKGPDNETGESDDQDTEQKINEDTEENFEENHGIDVKPPDEKEGQDDGSEDADLDLSDEMDLDGEGDEPEHDEQTHQEGRDAEDAMDLDIPDDQAAMDGATADENSHDEEENEIPRDDEEDGLDKLEAEALAEPEDQGIEEEAAPMEEEKNSIQDSAHGFNEEQADTEANGEDNEPEASPQAVDNQIQSSAQPFGVKGAAGEKSAAGLQDEAGEEEQMEDGENGRAAQQSMQGADAGQQQPIAQENENMRRNKNDKIDTNPRRSLGDALKKWMSRLKDISDSTEEESTSNPQREEDEEPQQMGDKAMEFEFVKEDDQAADAQAMADATAEQIGEMDRKALADDKEENEYGNADDDRIDVDEAEEEDTLPENVLDQKDQQTRQKVDKPHGAIDLRRKEMQDEASDDNEGDNGSGDKDDKGENELESDIEQEINGAFGRQHALDKDVENLDEEDKEPEVLDARKYEELRMELEQSVAEWRESGQDPREAQELWRMYTTLTRNLSFALCEQLRLILEPTLATKLKGDYRTGKRLNMRKIIPYIASQFKKDKIWLRRTKPSKRTYQIMIAIDDSRSMAESRSVQLAYETLAVITKALTQLEAGDVSVLSFGEDVRLLHPFEQPFSDEAGADVIRRFTFAQDRTHVRKMMETALGILDHARSTISGGSGSDLWQLQLVLSDGICEDHELVRSLVRRAAEQRIMVVFVVLDKRGDKDSITKMTNVTYGMDATGKPTLQMSRYMDTFPFDYYVVVKDIATLPEVLADLLRQYFSFVNA